MSSTADSHGVSHGITDDLRRRLMQKRLASLGTINPDGSPQVTLLQFSLDESDRMYLPTIHTSRKAKNILRRPDVTALVDTQFSWVACTGRARLIEGTEAKALNRRVYERLLTDAGMATIGRYLMEHEDATIEITPTKWMSWQMGSIVEWFAEEGIDPGNPAEWSRDLTEQ